MNHSVGKHNKPLLRDFGLTHPVTGRPIFAANAEAAKAKLSKWRKEEILEKSTRGHLEYEGIHNKGALRS